MRPVTDNLDFVAALLHGRRSHLAEGERLQELCDCRDLSELQAALSLGGDDASGPSIEFRLVRQLAQEIADLAPHLSGAIGSLMQWLVARFQVENLKLVLRHLVAGPSMDEVRPHLAPMPVGMELDFDRISQVHSLEALVDLLPRGHLRRQLSKVLDPAEERPKAFFLEAALDRGYFQELLLRTDALSLEDKESVQPIILQEVDTFHLLLAMRGRFHYQLEPARIQPFHVAGTRIGSELFEAILAMPDIRGMASLALGRAIDRAATAEPRPDQAGQDLDAAALEKLAWNRFWRLANRAFRRSHMGGATAVAYAELRRVEIANLITVVEGLRVKLPSERIRARLVPQQVLEELHV